tara:strand:- start:96 stop:761 length:666 start_codon:yes stop_codon:yes gene_type:complete
MESKRGAANVPLIVLIACGILLFALAATFMYASVNGTDYSNIYLEKIENAEIKNPITQLKLMFQSDSEEIGETEDDETEGQVIKINTPDGEKRIIVKNIEIGDLTIEEIETELINYASVVLKLYNLHNTPFTKNNPKIQIYIEESAYSVRVLKGDIFVEPGTFNKPDIILRTTYEEIFKMIEDTGYAGESFSSGKSSVELAASKFILFTKGYLSLYKEFNF